MIQHEVKESDKKYRVDQDSNNRRSALRSSLHHTLLVRLTQPNVAQLFRPSLHERMSHVRLPFPPHSSRFSPSRNTHVSLKSETLITPPPRTNHNEPLRQMRPRFVVSREDIKGRGWPPSCMIYDSVANSFTHVEAVLRARGASGKYRARRLRVGNSVTP